MTILKALQTVLHPNGRNTIDPLTLMMLESPRVHEMAQAADSFALNPALILLDTLAGVALDPHNGSRLGDFALDCGERWFFNLRFDRLSHYVEPFTMEKDNPLAFQLIQAMLVNLEGPMFQSAKEARSVAHELAQLDSEASAKGEIARVSFRSKMMPGAKSTAERQAVDAAADEVYRAFYEPVRDAVRARARSLNDAASPALIGKTYTQWVAGSLLRWIYALNARSTTETQLI